MMPIEQRIGLWHKETLEAIRERIKTKPMNPKLKVRLEYETAEQGLCCYSCVYEKPYEQEGVRVYIQNESFQFHASCLDALLLSNTKKEDVLV